MQPEEVPQIPPATAQPFPTQGRLLGLDYGHKRIGIAVSTPDQTIASPLENYTRRNRDLDQKHLQTIIVDYRIVGLVVGLPVHMSGDEGGKAREAREFGAWVAGFSGLPVRYWDERYTSLLAEAWLMEAELSSRKRKARMDKVAAQILLRSYLESPDKEAAPQSME